MVTVAEITVPAAFTPVTAAVTLGSAMPPPFVKPVMVTPVAKPVPVIVMGSATAPTPTSFTGAVEYANDVTVGAAETINLNEGEYVVTPPVVWLIISDGAVVMSPAVGDVVTTKSSVVGLTYEMMPASEPAPAVNAPVSMFSNPVPVKVTVVPTGAPTTREVCEAITGPVTVAAAGNSLLPLTVMLNGPAVEPLVAVIDADNVVPVLPAT
jgi:hypothetical protein